MNQLKFQIHKGYCWLMCHGREGISHRMTMAGNKVSPYDPKLYQKCMERYKELVDQAKEQGIEECDCWELEPGYKIEDLTFEQRIVVSKVFDK